MVKLGPVLAKLQHLMIYIADRAAQLAQNSNQVWYDQFRRCEQNVSWPTYE